MDVWEFRASLVYIQVPGQLMIHRETMSNNNTKRGHTLEREKRGSMGKFGERNKKEEMV